MIMNKRQYETTINVGDTVTVENTRGSGETAETTTMVGPAYRDSEGTLRVKNLMDEYGWEPNLERDEDGYFARGVVVVSVKARS